MTQWRSETGCWTQLHHEGGWALHPRGGLPAKRLAPAALLAALDADEAVLPAPLHGWQDFLHRLAHGVHRLGRAEPRVLAVLVSPDPTSCWPPPLQSEVWSRRILDGLAAEGFGGEEALAAHRALCTFLLGHLVTMLAAGGPGRSGGSAALSDVDFEDGLEQLLDRLERLRTPGRGRRHVGLALVGADVRDNRGDGRP